MSDKKGSAYIALLANVLYQKRKNNRPDDRLLKTICRELNISPDALTNQISEQSGHIEEEYRKLLYQEAEAIFSKLEIRFDEN